MVTDSWLNISFAKIPVINEANSIFINEMVKPFNPRGPIFFLKLIKSKTAQNVAEILVAKASPGIPIYFAKIIFKIIFKQTDTVAFLVEVLVSSKE